MVDISELRAETQASLSRLLPRLEARFAHQTEEGEWQAYVQRVQQHFPRLFRLLYHLYAHRYDFFYHLE